MIDDKSILLKVEVGAALIKKIKNKNVQNKNLKRGIYRYEHAE